MQCVISLCTHLPLVHITGSIPSDTLTELAERILSLLQLLLDLAVVRFNQVSYPYLMPSLYCVVFTYIDSILHSLRAV